MPITSDAFQKTTSGSDFYFIVLNDNATALKYGTYLGGNTSRTHVDGGTSRFDKFGIVYHSVCGGCGGLSDFPTTPGAKSRTNNNSNCNNAAFKFDLSSLRARFQTNNLAFKIPNFDKACYPDIMVFQNLSIGGEIYKWDLGDGTVITKLKSDTVSIRHQYQEEGKYFVKLKAIDDNTCSEVDSITKVVNYFKDVIEIGDGGDLCEGSPFELTSSGGAVYSWRNLDNTFKSALPTVEVKPEDSTTYYISITDSDGCKKSDSVRVNVIPKLDLKWKYNFNQDCIHRPILRVQNISEALNVDKIFFDFGDGATSDLLDVEHEYSKDSLYHVKLIGQREICAFEEVVDIPIFTLGAPNVFTPDASSGFNDNLVIRLGTSSKTPADIGVKIGIDVVDRWGKKVFESSDYKNDWNAHNIEGGIYYYQLRLGSYATCKSWLHVVK